MKLIDKDAVIAEIEKRIKKYATIDVGDSGELDALYGAKCKALMEILSFLNTLEIEEVDLEKEIDECMKQYHMIAVGRRDFSKIAKHFIELGLNVRKEDK